jgi:hypothetical protein
MVLAQKTTGTATNMLDFAMQVQASARMRRVRNQSLDLSRCFVSPMTTVFFALTFLAKVRTVAANPNSGIDR